MTFSIVARSADGESWGVAVASKFLAVGSPVPAAVAGVGAIATQADANVAYKGQALAHLDDGATASVALQRLLEDDEGRDHRQVGIVDVDGNAASHTGPGVPRLGRQPHRRRLRDPGQHPHRLRGGRGDGGGLAGLARGRAAGAAPASRRWPPATRPVATRAVGSRRRSWWSRTRRATTATTTSRSTSASTTTPSRSASWLGCSTLSELYLTASTEDEQVPITPDLEAELEELAQAAGARDFAAWVGTENYEMRVASDFSWIDVRVLEIIRATKA